MPSEHLQHIVILWNKTLLNHCFFQFRRDFSSNPRDMDPPKAETDGFEVGEVLTGPDDCRIVLYYDHLRFILVMTKTEIREDGDVVADLFLKIEEAENDPDEMMFDRYLEDVRELAILACKHTMYTLAASVPKPSSKQLSLEDFLHPATFCLQLRAMKGKLQAVGIDDISEFARMHEPVPLAMDFVPRSVPALTPSVEIEFIEDLFMRKILKVSKHGEVCVFKSATQGNEDQLRREISVLQQISDKWEPDHPDHPHVPRLLGLVTSGGQVIGMLEEFIDGTNLHELDLDDASSAQRRKWKRQIEQAIKQLHQSGVVWGDVKPENVLIDKAAHAWLVDFGGSSTDGWVDEDLAETMEGDFQGLRRLVEFWASDIEIWWTLMAKHSRITGAYTSRLAPNTSVRLDMASSYTYPSIVVADG